MYKYEIEIKRRPHWEGYSLFYGKRYGDFNGGATECKTKEELINKIKDIFKEWEEYDAIVSRKGDKVNINNLEFLSFTDEILIGDLFGNSRLTAWF